jgi:hypothetical protein
MRRLSNVTGVVAVAPPRNALSAKALIQQLLAMRLFAVGVGMAASITRVLVQHARLSWGRRNAIHR